MNQNLLGGCTLNQTPVSYNDILHDLFTTSHLVMGKPDLYEVHMKESVVKNRVLYWKLDNGNYMKIDPQNRTVIEVKTLEGEIVNNTVSPNEIIIVNKAIAKFRELCLRQATSSPLKKLGNFLLTCLNQHRVVPLFPSESQITLTCSHEYFAKILSFLILHTEQAPSSAYSLSETRVLRFSPDNKVPFEIYEYNEKVFAPVKATLREERDAIRFVLNQLTS